MIRELDLTALEQPELKLTLPDKTVIFVTLPEEKLVEKLMSAAPELRPVSNSQDPVAVKALYDLLADMLSNNRTGQQFTAEDLRDKHGVKFAHLVFIYKAYLDFIMEIQNAKN